MIVTTKADQQDELLRRAFAPSDVRAWRSLERSHPDSAAAVRELIALGLEPEQFRQYAAEQNYLDEVGAWLTHAAAHVRRLREEDEDAAPVGPDGDSVE